MASLIKDLWTRLTGGRPEAGSQPEPVGRCEDYKGFRITATPFSESGQFQTAGRIEKEVDGQARRHDFIRAERHPTRDAAEDFALTKGRQIIDQNGERLFLDPA